MEQARDFFLKIFKYLSKPEMRNLPGQLAFFLVMTIIPLVALIATLAANLSFSVETISNAINSSVPKEIASILNSIITGSGINFNIVVFYLSAFILASNGTYSMINISNEIYKTEPKNIIQRRIKAVVMIFMIVGLFIFLIAVPVFGGTLAKIILELTGSNAIIDTIHKILILLKYPIIIVVLYCNLKIIYIISPDEEIPSSTTTKGALFTAIGWILSTEIFSFYLEKFARYDIFYGSISNILILLLWIYLISYIFIFGMIINASSYKEEE